MSTSDNILALLEEDNKYELVFIDGKLFVNKTLLNDNCGLLKSRTSGNFKDSSDSFIDLKQFPKKYFAYLFNYLVNDVIPTTFIEMMEFINIASYLCVNNFRERIARRIPVIHEKDIYEAIEKYEKLFLNDDVFGIFINQLIAYIPTFAVKFNSAFYLYLKSNNSPNVTTPVSVGVEITSLYIKGSCLGDDGYCCIHPKPVSDLIDDEPEVGLLHKYCYECLDEKGEIKIPGAIPPIAAANRQPIDIDDDNMFWRQNGSLAIPPLEGGDADAALSAAFWNSRRDPNRPKPVFVDKSRCCKHISDIKELGKLLKYIDFVKKVLSGTVYRGDVRSFANPDALA